MIHYKGYSIDVVPVTKYVLYINGKRTERGCELLTGRSIDKLVEAGKELVDQAESGQRAVRENDRYIQFGPFGPSK